MWIAYGVVTIHILLTLTTPGMEFVRIVLILHEMCWVNLKVQVDRGISSPDSFYVGRNCKLIKEITVFLRQVIMLVYI